MASRIEDYAVIGNCESLALVGRDGSIDWLGLPRFDSPAFFAALLGDRNNGRWAIAPVEGSARATRQYRASTLILETTFETGSGVACLTDFMAASGGASHVVRLVRCISGSVRLHMELIVRFGYGEAVPWVSRQQDGRLQLVAGPDRLLLETPVEVQGEHLSTQGDFQLSAGHETFFVLSWSDSFTQPPPRLDPAVSLADAEAFWREWSAKLHPTGDWSSAMRRSMLTLKSLSHWQTGGIVAAGTTSLPEKLGGSRNWDYRYCWLRDATLTLYALMEGGMLDEARAWRQWLLRAVAGSPAQIQIMYGLAGERRLDEYEIPWLTGYEGSSPVRVGNAASGQLQLDVCGEVLDALFVARETGLAADASTWALEYALIEHLRSIWQQPDDGIWEVRGGRRHFTHSKVMAWVAFDRAVRSAEKFELQAPVAEWRAVRDQIHEEVCRRGFDAALGSFVQSYGSTALDASLLLIPIVGFLPAADPRVVGTLAAIEKHLLRDGFVMRYATESGTDGLPPGEGAFLACSFWLVDNYVLQHRLTEARALFERLLALCNDVGLLAEEYDVAARRQVGNFPQAFSHLALLNSARNLSAARGPVHQRSSGTSQTAAAHGAH